MSYEKITRTNLDDILKELAREYKKLAGKSFPAEIILVGGAAIIENYGFRDMTTDVDALIYASSAMKEAINTVGEKHNLPYGWLNDDFLKTASFSSILREISTYYKSFGGVLSVRTISAEYLIAMKLKSGRKYKNDLSDVAGILAERNNSGNPISRQQINEAFHKLYGPDNNISEDGELLLDKLFEKEISMSSYYEILEKEKLSKELLINFEKEYTDVLKPDNVDEVLKALLEKRKK